MRLHDAIDSDNDQRAAHPVRQRGNGQAAHDVEHGEGEAGDEADLGIAQREGMLDVFEHDRKDQPVGDIEHAAERDDGEHELAVTAMLSKTPAPSLEQG
jgi:hypothetical protein